MIYQMSKKTYRRWQLVFLVGFLASFTTKGSLREGELLLDKQTIKGTKKIHRKALAQYYHQKTNKKWLNLPFLLWIYRLGERALDKEAIEQRISAIEKYYQKKLAAISDERKIKRLQQRRDSKLKEKKELLQKGTLLMRWGEPPVLYVPSLVPATSQNFLSYLKSKGYFDAQVCEEVKIHDSKVKVTYHIQEKEPYLIAELRTKTCDEAIAKLLQVQQQSLLQEGAQYDQEVLYRERERIDTLLSNHGYFDFGIQYIQFNVQVKSKTHTVVIETVIEAPTEGSTHPVADIAQVVFVLDEAQNNEAPTQEERVYGGITFKGLGLRFRPKVLSRKIPIAPSRIYQKQDIVETQRRLSRLDLFQYVNITNKVLEDGRLVTHIHASPLNRYQVVNELGMQVSQRSWLPSPLYKLSLQGRNLCHSLDILTLSTSLSIEATNTTSKTALASSQAWSINLGFALPQFLFPLSNKIKTYLDRFHPTTNLSLGYHFSRRPEYIQNVFKGWINYGWKGRSISAYKLTLLRVDLVNTSNKSTAFQQQLKNLERKGNNLYRTFEPSLVTHIALQATFCKKPAAVTDHSMALLELSFESGGTFQNIFDLRKTIQDLGLEYYQYIKSGVAYSQRIPLYAGALFAYRLRAGLAYPYSRYKVLPYSRYYFAGGTNGMRAWSPRSLGPGTYSPPQDSDSEEQTHTEQPGEILLQGSVEFRQKLIGFLEGALFFDTGNIWMLNEDNREGAQFHLKNAYKGIALGTGIGIRLNFQFLVLRLDMGFKVYDPAQPQGKRFVKFPNRPTYNIGVNYPF